MSKIDDILNKIINEKLGLSPNGKNDKKYEEKVTIGNHVFSFDVYKEVETGIMDFYFGIRNKEDDNEVTDMTIKKKADIETLIQHLQKISKLF